MCALSKNVFQTFGRVFLTGFSSLPGLPGCGFSVFLALSGLLQIGVFH